MPNPICPRCFSGFVRRTRRKGPVGRLVSWFSIYPFRCQLCQHRFHALQRKVNYKRIDEDRREYERLTVNLGATIVAGTIRGQGTITDISMAGCSLRTEIPLEAGNLVYMELQLPDQADPIEVEVAALRNIASNHASVEFLQFERGERERLRHFIRKIILEISSRKG